ncbi:MAG TPA: TonB-dependent receptor [Pseudomonadales bacterium]|nr:TonB-dependent receptor [Pseudomonadales bacterium]
MSSAFRVAARATVAACVLAVPPFANAGVANAGAEASTPEQITVLATRTDTPIDVAPAPVEIIDEQAIDARQSGVPADFLRGAPGFSVSRSGGIGAITEVRLRGAEANHLLVLVDGIDINDPALGSSVDFANLDMIGMTRVEILPGAQSALWGSDALAGAMNFETTPAPGTTARNVWIEGGSNDTMRESIQLAQRDDAWYYALDARHTETAGTNIATSGGEDDGYRNTTFHLNSGYTGERGSLQVVARSVDAQSEYDPTPAPDFVPVDGNLELDVHQRLLGVFGTFDQTEHLTQRLTFRHYDSRNDNLTDGARDSSSDGDENQITYQGDYSFAAGPTSQLVTWAYEYTREGFNQRGAPSDFGDPNQDQHMDTKSVIGEWVIDWNGASASLSARHDDNSDFDDSNDYRLAVRIPLLRPGTTLFLSAGTGTKDPTFVERFGFTPDTFIGNPNLRPERSHSASITLDQMLGERASIRISYFHDKLEDEINGFFFDVNRDGFTAINSDGNSHRQGVEFSLTAQLLDTLNARFDYTYLDATQPGTVHQEDELRRPHNTGRIVLDYAPLPDRLSFELGAAYVGTHEDDDFSTFPARRVSLDAYTLIHCTARYRITERVEFTGRVENASDEHYQDVFGYATPGRQGYVGINVKL